MAPATIARILATLRTALAAAVREGLIALNPASAARAPRPAGCHPVVRTRKREQAAGRRTTPGRGGVGHPPPGHVPTRLPRRPVLRPVVAGRPVRATPSRTVRPHMVHSGPRRADVDGRRAGCLRRRPDPCRAAQSPASRRTIALDDATVAVLRHYRRQQQAEAEEWTIDSRGHVFTLPGRWPVLPSVASHTFTRRVRAQHLPPVRLHDLQHGAASLNFAAHDDLKAVQALLRHSSPATTANIYISVLPELARRRAQATANLLLTAARVKPDAGSSQAWPPPVLRRMCRDFADGVGIDPPAYVRGGLSDTPTITGDPSVQGAQAVRAATLLVLAARSAPARLGALWRPDRHRGSGVP
jgi:hypothetical protein